ETAPAGTPSQGPTVTARRRGGDGPSDQGGRGLREGGGGGRLGGARAGQVGEERADDGRVLHGGDDPQPTATAGTGEDIEG
ncbi:MAG: hypothetical protein Q8Q14_00470, partial [Gemmatimonadales bacterium]|nr:hypothetical protein [Gemmatimonadales bacterium]